MEKKTSYVLGFLIVLFFVSGVILRADSGFCPIFSVERKAVLDLPQEKDLIPKENYYVPRNQVLVEIGTGIW